MPPKVNPLKLNPLQRKTLALLQAMAEQADDTARDADSGAIAVGPLPQPHGNHFHLGPWIVMRSDATGLQNQGVMMALIRKGLIEPAPGAGGLALTSSGQSYDTGMRDAILHGSDH